MFFLNSIQNFFCDLTPYVLLKHLLVAQQTKRIIFQITEGVWMDQDSPLIFPAGWAYKVGYSLCANDDYINHAKDIANALKTVCFLFILT